VEQYARYLGGSTDRTYVIAQAIEICLAQDRDYRKARSDSLAVVAGPVRAMA
jgi:hypothetical protein